MQQKDLSEVGRRKFELEQIIDAKLEANQNDSVVLEIVAGAVENGVLLEDRGWNEFVQQQVLTLLVDEVMVVEQQNGFLGKVAE